MPLRIIRDKHGQWDQAAWKIEAFNGNPLKGNKASPQT